MNPKIHSTLIIVETNMILVCWGIAVDISSTLALGLTGTLVGGQWTIENYLVTNSDLWIGILIPLSTLKPVDLICLEVEVKVVVEVAIGRDPERAVAVSRIEATLDEL